MPRNQDVVSSSESPVRGDLEQLLHLGRQGGSPVRRSLRPLMRGLEDAWQFARRKFHVEHWTDHLAHNALEPC